MELLAGRYELAEPLGAGGMAQVSAAYDQVLDRRVAVKLIHPGQLADPVSRERFTREARAAAGLHHPNTVAVYDYGEHNGRPFIVMELVEGRTLADLLRESGRLPAGEVTRIADGVLAGLAEAHRGGLVHRDVKPSNILLPDDGGVKLADFGIAATGDAGTTLTAAGQVVGTARYLPPECAAGERATPASDVYSFGAVLYECFAGRAPFYAESAVALALAHRHEPVPSLVGLAPDTPPAVASVVERSLAKDPEGRFADAGAMREALSRAADGVPVDLPTVAAVPVTATRALDRNTETSVVEPVDATRVVEADGRWRAWPWLLAVLAVAAAVIVAILLANLGDDPGVADDLPGATVEEGADADQDAETGAADDVAGDDEAATADEDGTPDEGPDVSDLNSLLGAIAAATGLGEKSDDLLDDLRDLRDEPNGKDAWELIEDIGEWMADGELDSAVGAQAIAVLAEEFRPDSPDLAPVSTLHADVATSLPEWGAKGGDLLDDLTDLLATEPPGQRRQRADKLIEEIERWTAAGELDTDRSAEAVAVLAPLARP